MAIKTNYNFKGIKLPEVTIRVIRIFGSSKEGWNSLVGVYNTTIETVEETIFEENNTIVTGKMIDVERVHLIEEFNHSASYVEDERGYVTIYKSLMDKYGGEEI